MAKLKISCRFWVVPNHILSDKSLSMKAKWLFAFIQSKPDGWDFSVERMCNQSSDGKSSITAWLQELEDKWYLFRTRYKNEQWQWDCDYELTDEPENHIWKSDMEPSPIIRDGKSANNSNNIISIDIILQSKQELPDFSDSFHSKLKEFFDLRKQMRKPIKDVSALYILKKCREVWEPRALEVLDYSIWNSYQGLFWNQKEKSSAKKEKVARNAFVEPQSYTSSNRFKPLVWS